MLRMRPAGRLIFAFVIMLGAYGAAGVQAAPKPWTVTPDKVGPLRFGMSLTEAYRALNVEAPPEMISIANSVTCQEALIPAQIDAVMMFENNRLSRITFYGDSPLKTSTGIGIGATESEVMAKYPLAESTPRAHNPAPAKDLTFWAKTNVSGIRFKTNDRREVDTILTGGQSITYSGGCA